MSQGYNIIFSAGFLNGGRGKDNNQKILKDKDYK